MGKYTDRPKCIKINEITERNSFSIKDFLKIKKRGAKLNTYLEKSYINSNIDSGYYCKKSEYFLVSNRALNESLLLNRDEFINVTPYGFSTKNKCEIKKGDVIIGNNGTLGEIALVLDDFKGITNSNVTLLRFNGIKNTYYFVGFFYSQYFKEYCKTISTKSGTQEFITRGSLEDMLIPFPTEKNNKNPEKIENLISIIVQNIINKEQIILEKKNKINEIIRKGIEDFQLPAKFVYKYPRIQEIKNIGRLDTGMYEKKYKFAEREVHNTDYEKFSLDENDLKGGNTPKIRIFEPTNKKFLWFTPTDMKRGELKEKHYIKALSYNLSEKLALLFSNRSNCGDCILYDPKTYKNGGHHNQGIYRKEFENKNFIENIFILCLFNSKFYQDMISHIATGATFGELRMEQYANIELPKFSEEIQIEIANLYYNEHPKNENLDFDNYLELEKERNKKQGIFQLNMELFSLKEKLESLIDKVIMEEYIDIDLYY